MSTPLDPSPGHFRILYFASVKDLTQRDSENMTAPLPLSKLFETLEQKYNGLKMSRILESCLVTVNLEYVDVAGNAVTDKETIINDGDEVALIPPVSSG